MLEAPFCEQCKHYEKPFKCSAFKVIPDEILLGKNNHLQPLPNQDNDIVFEPIKKAG